MSTPPNKPHDSSVDPPENDLADSSPDEPRLSIGHLMIWALCVAVYLSAFRTAVLSSNASLGGDPAGIMWAVAGVVQGTGLAALLLLVNRRFRGLKFPRHGGEVLWVIAGIQAVMELAHHFIRIQESVSWIGAALLVYGIIGIGIWSIVYLYAILQAETRRWKIVFVIMVATGIAVPLLIGLTVRFNSPLTAHIESLTVRFVQRAVIVASLAIAVWIDCRQPHRYPWTHWTGIILYVTSFAGATVWYAVTLAALLQQA